MTWLIIIAIVFIAGLLIPKLGTFLCEFLDIFYWLYKTIGYIVIALLFAVIIIGFFN